MFFRDHGAWIRCRISQVVDLSKLPSNFRLLIIAERTTKDWIGTPRIEIAGRNELLAETNPPPPLSANGGVKSNYSEQSRTSLSGVHVSSMRMELAW